MYAELLCQWSLCQKRDTKISQSSGRTNKFFHNLQLLIFFSTPPLQINQIPRSERKQSRKLRKPPRTSSVDWYSIRTLRPTPQPPKKSTKAYSQLNCCCLLRRRTCPRIIAVQSRKDNQLISLKMVKEQLSVLSSMANEFRSASPRRESGFQNMPKMTAAEQSRKNSVNSQQAAPKAANSFGPMFRDATHFKSLHFC